MSTKTITKNLGGDRLGSGSKMDVKLHNYNRSNHDLSYAWRSTMNVGTLVPFMKLLILNGDRFSINLNTIAKTIPTIGPLFGAFKMQLDIFECPLRLYNGLLHNNMTKIGNNMSQVKIPKMILQTVAENPWDNKIVEQISNSSLLKYFGISGVLDLDRRYLGGKKTVERKANAIPILAYWDIYKNYYANKQEEIGVVIRRKPIKEIVEFTKVTSNHINYNMSSDTESILPNGVTNPYTWYQEINPTSNHKPTIQYSIKFYWNGDRIDETQIKFVTYDTERQQYNVETPETYYEWVEWNWEDRELTCTIPIGLSEVSQSTQIIGICYNVASQYTSETELKTFPLSNIDNARIQILKKTGLNEELKLNEECNFLPYNTVFEKSDDDRTLSRFPQQGLGIKTYQSDILENWLSTEWIDGENGINQITAIDTSSGSFQIDALNLANKVYNMLNRIAVSGGTYEDWQEAVYTADTNRRAETPIYKGGLACEICFDEVISTAATQEKPLGTLGGRAVIPKDGIRGGHIEIRCGEPAYVIGIISITPRIDYSQGNDWDMFELDTMNDLHKPALDGIGFEDLLQERAAWWGTYDDGNGDEIKLAMGKTVAWINYMTNINKAYGEFADTKMFMTLNRQYECSDEENGIADLTTYIDPAKYNYAFAETTVDAQNFWIQIGVNVFARRVMSAKILPNL